MQEKQLQELLGSLSLTEKIGQLVQVPGEVLNAEGQAVAFRAKRLSPVTRQHHPVLYLILILFQHLEEIIDAVEILVAFPK